MLISGQGVIGADSQKPVFRKMGFSVLEVICTMALIALSLWPLYNLQQGLTRSSIHLERISLSIDVQNSALDYLESMNPMLYPDGRIDMGDWQLSWTSTELSKQSPARGYLGQSNFAIGFYDIEAELSHDDRPFKVFQIRKVGWEYIGEDDLF